MSAEVEAKASMAALADNILKAMELAEEFRRLAAEAERASKIPTIMLAQRADARRGVWEQAAQMLEEKLNG